MQLTATINPDFGQVESDDLVVNFGANETFFSDKRPFFTENQGIFDFGTPSRLQPAAVHAPRRRPGRRRQRRRRHHRGGEAQRQPRRLQVRRVRRRRSRPAGRSFDALRLMRDFKDQNVGLMVTQVDRPFLDRNATVVGVDHNWRPTPSSTSRTA